MAEKHSAALRKGWLKRKVPDRERFLSKIDRTGPCWNWIGTRFLSGYGSFNFRQDGRQRIVKASRQAWRYFRNEEPGDSMVLHKCDNKACVNPDHLYLGTHQQNMRDSAERGTHPSGERHSRFLRVEGLTDRVRDLRAARYPYEMIADWLGVSRNTVLRCLGKA